ncbi:phage tail protein [Levilactobacillus brevis]|nr:phage tail protein [Levilactobacillus brevis]
MAGGIWTTQNKERPGAYINTVGAPQAKADTTSGRVLLVNGVQLDWGPQGVVELDSGSDFQALLGAPLSDNKLATIREALKGAATVLYLNLNGGTAATITDEALPWSFTANYAGAKGNDLTVSVTKDATDETRLTVQFLYGTAIVDEQVIHTTTAAGLKSNDFVTVKLTDTADAQTKLEALAGKTTYKLTGGVTTPVDVTDVLSDTLATKTFNVATTAGYPAESNVHALLVQLIEGLRDNEGYKVTAVVPGVEGLDYDHEAVTAVINGVELSDGEKLDATTAAAYVAGVASAAGATGSLTYVAYPDAVDANPRLTNEATIRNLANGYIVFTARRDGSVVVEQDINTLTTFTEAKPKDFHKNRTIRTLDAIANDTQDVFEGQFIGKVNNDSTGRDLFKANRVAYLRTLETSGAIGSFDPSDLTVEPGDEKDSILVTLGITPVDAMEKLYMTITVY